MSPHFWAGEREAFGKTSLYVGPILLAFDPAYNTMDPGGIPEMEGRQLKLEPTATNKSIQPWLLRRVQARNGQWIILCEFATAGAYGNEYVSWLPIRNVPAVIFDRQRPVWTGRIP